MLALAAALALSAPMQVEIHYMPPGTALQLKIGEKTEEVRYFTFPEYKLLLKLDGDLWDANERLRIYKDLDTKYMAIIGQKDAIIRTLQDDRSVLDERLKRSDENWHAAEKKLVEASGGPIWPYVLAAGGAVVGIVGATLYISTLIR